MTAGLGEFHDILYCLRSVPMLCHGGWIVPEAVENGAVPTVATHMLELLLVMFNSIFSCL